MLSKSEIQPKKIQYNNGKVTQVTFQNVPAFTTHLDIELDVPHLGKVTRGSWVRFLRESLLERLGMLKAISLIILF
jgi:hypothetical protein